MKTQKIEQTVTKQHLKTFKPFVLIRNSEPLSIAVIQIIHRNQHKMTVASKGS